MGRRVTLRPVPAPLPLEHAGEVWVEAHTGITRRGSKSTVSAIGPDRDAAIEHLRVRVEYLEQPEPEHETVEVDW